MLGQVIRLLSGARPRFRSGVVASLYSQSVKDGQILRGISGWVQIAREHGAECVGEDGKGSGFVGVHGLPHSLGQRQAPAMDVSEGFERQNLERNTIKFGAEVCEGLGFGLNCGFVQFH